MLRILSPLVLAGSLIPVWPAPSASAQTPGPGAAYPGADLFRRGWGYDQGLGTPIDIPAAMRLYRQAADAGHPLANARLAYLYYSGNGVTPDKAEAERRARGRRPGVLKAAGANDPVAQLLASLMYFDGLGVAR